MVVATVQTSLHSIFSWLERWVAAATLLDWILIGAGVAALFLAWRVVNAPVRLGPIEVSASEAESTTTDFGRKELAALRLELAQWGLIPAGGVPAGSPTAKVAAAVEASPLPYGKFLSALIALIPLPASAIAFKVTATMQDDGEKQAPFGLTYHLVRADSGTTLDLDVVWAKSPTEAIVHAGGLIFQKIAACAEGIYPAWSQWPNVQAMGHYRAAIKHEKAQDWSAATECFGDAAGAAPENMLARLRIANCLEQQAGSAMRKSTGNDVAFNDAAALRIQALNLYRHVAAREPDIFEARYRASVLLSVLADTHNERRPGELTERRLGGRARNALRVITGLDDETGPDVIETALREQARKEAGTARRLLHPLATLRRGHRMRNRLEIRGAQRRRTRRALRISRLCLLVRRQWSPGDEHVPWNFAELLRVWWRIELRAHFLLRERNAGWQAHYNAACFYALLPEVSATMRFPPQSREELEHRMYEHLGAALRDPSRDLNDEYVRTGDPDFRVVRGRPMWAGVIASFCQRAALLHYHRSDGEYNGWGLFVWGSGLDPSARRDWPETLEWDERTEGRVTFRVPLAELSRPVGVIVQRHGEKDLPDDRTFRPLEQAASNFWLYDDEREIHLEERATNKPA